MKTTDSPSLTPEPVRGGAGTPSAGALSTMGLTNEQTGKAPGEWTDEALRIAIAEACGWKFSSDKTIGPQGQEWNHLKWKDVVPRYPKDLNAMREAEGTLGLNRCDEYEDYLVLIVGGEAVANSGKGKVANLFIWHATARQRALAFVKTLGLSPRI